MDFKESLSKLKSSKVFKEWKTKEYYLVHGFVTISSKDEKVWQIGYYNKEKDVIVSFDVSNPIKQNDEEKAFKPEGIVIEKLDPKKVKISFAEAIMSANEIQKEKYSQHDPFRKIYIIQEIEGNTVWNVTYVTNTFKTINIRIDAMSGKILKDGIVEVFSFKKGKK